MDATILDKAEHIKRFCEERGTVESPSATRGNEKYSEKEEMGPYEIVISIARKEGIELRHAEYPANSATNRDKRRMDPPSSILSQQHREYADTALRPTTVSTQNGY